MQTVKQILANGVTHLFETDGVVTFRPSTVMGFPAGVIFDGTDGRDVLLKEGTIYVMNDMGKTVDKFDLDARKTQQSAA